MTRRTLQTTVCGVTAVLGVLVIPGCAQKTDWIEGTLVTVDVSGTWRGTAKIAPSYSGDMELTVKQNGASVSGEGRLRADKLSIVGTVRGDVFTFSDIGGRLRAEATVTGDELSGSGSTNLPPPAGGTKIRFTLARSVP